MKYRFTSKKSVAQHGWRWQFEVITAISSTISQPGQGTCALFGTFNEGKCPAPRAVEPQDNPAAAVEPRAEIPEHP